MITKTSILICKNQHILNFASSFFFVVEQMEKLEYIVFYNTKPLFWDAKKVFKNKGASGSGVILGVFFGTLSVFRTNTIEQVALFDLGMFSSLFVAKGGHVNFSP